MRLQERAVRRDGQWRVSGDYRMKGETAGNRFWSTEILSTLQRISEIDDDDNHKLNTLTNVSTCKRNRY